MLHKMAFYEVRKEALPQALALVRAFVDEVGRKEGGTASYKAFQDRDHPTRFTHVMSFRTPAAEEYHQKTAWHKRLMEGLGPLCSEAPRWVSLTAVEPV